MPWYEWTQNNSGGSFDVDENVTHRLFIEADRYEFAEVIAKEKGVYYNGCAAGMDCSCCGDRWYEGYEITLPHFLQSWKRNDESVEVDNIEDYAKWMKEAYGWVDPDAYIYYKDGRKVAI